MQILGLVWAGHTAPAGRVKELVGKQRTDGGWGQTDYHQSDAFATGEALWALHESGMASSDPVYRRGVDFILRTQQEDGTWHVVSRSFGFQPYFQSGFPYEQDQWIRRREPPWRSSGCRLRQNSLFEGPAISCLTLSKK